jgi:hypothetical protein
VIRTKNSSKSLPLVPRGVEKVIPSEVLGRKIIADGHSINNTIGIAKSLE